MKLSSSKLAELQARACLLRRDIIRATTAAGSGHPTSCLSSLEIATTLFFETMHFDPADHVNPCNDRFILSKGHAAPLLYAVWKQLGAISDDELMTLRQFTSRLEGHPTPRFPWAEAATGSLGQGLSIGAGMAAACKADRSPARIFVLLGDSELSEGSNWEAVQLAEHYKLDNLIAIIDINRLGQRGETLWGRDIKRYQEVFTAFGWLAFTVDGHNLDALAETLAQATKAPDEKPRVILASTIKGHNLGPTIEDKNGFHGKTLPEAEAERVLAALHCAKVTTPKSSLTKKCDQEVRQPQNNTMPLAPYSSGQQMATRKAYGESLAALGTVDKEIVCLDAEVKNSTYTELFEKAHPQRFYECFIAEQNMIGMGVGFVSRGKKPFCSTFASFMSRAHDQLRMAAIGRAPVRCAGSHAGVSIGQDGPSQMGLEDVALFRSLPESIVLYPCDAVATWALVGLMGNYRDGISYLRLTRNETPIIYAKETLFKIGGCHILRSTPQDCCCVVAAGITLFEALKAADELAKEDIFIRVIDCYSIKPLPVQIIEREVMMANEALITVEDHYREGGLGEALDSALSHLPLRKRILAVTKLPRSGKPAELMAYEEIDKTAIIRTVKELRK